MLAGCAGLAHPRGEVKRTLTYAFVTVGRHAGDGEVKVDGNTRVGHYTFNDRGRGPDISTVAYLDDAGGFLTFHSVGHDYLKANVDEQLEHEDGQLAWKSTSEKGSAAAGYYVPLQGELDGDALLAAAIARAPGGRLKLLPAGEAWIEDRAAVDVSGGGTTYHLTRVAIAGVGFSPTLVWLDADGELFAEVSPWSERDPRRRRGGDRRPGQARRTRRGRARARPSSRARSRIRRRRPASRSRTRGCSIARPSRSSRMSRS